MATKNQYSVAVVNEQDLSKTGVIFAASGTTSTILNCQGTAPTGIFLPANWVLSDISFEVSKYPDGTFYALMNFDGTAFGINSSAGAQFIPLSPAMFNSILYLKVVSSNAQPAMTIDFSLCPIFQGIHA